MIQWMMTNPNLPATPVLGFSTFSFHAAFFFQLTFDLEKKLTQTAKISEFRTYVFDIRRLGDVFVEAKGEHGTHVNDHSQHNTRPKLGCFHQKSTNA